MEVQAAIGLEQIKGLTGFVESRRRIAKAVASSLEGTNLRVLDASLSTDAGDQSHSWMLIPIQVTGEDAVAKKLKITNGLNAAGIETRPVLTGNFLAQPSIRRLYDHLPPPSAFPAASRITETSFLVGSHHDLTEEQIDYLVATLSNLAQNAK
jgi:CDP-6-deoxy-D-xylo-4-hexulose-3-dehydrase